MVHSRRWGRTSERQFRQTQLEKQGRWRLPMVSRILPSSDSAVRWRRSIAANVKA